MHESSIAWVATGKDAPKPAILVESIAAGQLGSELMLSPRWLGVAAEP